MSRVTATEYLDDRIGPKPSRFRHTNITLRTDLSNQIGVSRAHFLQATFKSILEVYASPQALL